MKKDVILAGFALLLVFAFATSLLMAQDVKTGDKSASSERGRMRAVTGCLHSVSGNNQFRLDAQDGSKWELTSDQVKLASQVGHTVTVIGSVMMAASANGDGSGRLAVTKLAIVSSGCQTDIPMQQ